MATQPTDVEYPLLDTDSMVTKTDLNGVITYANEDYVRNSGFTAQELIGKPHNIVHHPDMPAEVFADLWNSLKLHRPWTGAIKTMRKDGQYFWVMANITPNYENGQHIGYMAVRTKATKAQIAAVEKNYRLFKQGKAFGLKIESGDIFRKTLFTEFDFLKHFTIKKRLVTVLSILSVVMLTIGGMGLYGLTESSNSLKSVYQDRTIPMYQIASIQKYLITNRVLVTASLTDSPEKLKENVAKVERNIEEISTLWTAYTATYLTPEEKQLADKFANDRKTFVTEGLEPAVTALHANDLTLAQKIIVEKIRPLYEPLNTGTSALLQLQMDETQRIYQNAQMEFTSTLQIMVGLVITSLTLAIFMGVSLFRAIIRPLTLTADLIVRADNKNFIEIKNDGRTEITTLLDAFKTAQVKNSFNEAEAKREADRNLRIRIGLDNVSANVVIADSERKIIYLNQSAKNMLSIAEADIRKELPNFSVSKLVGENIDVFHKDPAHQKQLLEELKQTVIAKISIGGRAMVVVANPVIGENGEHLGSVAEWKDRTAEVAIENEVADVVESIVNGDFTKRIIETNKEDFILLISQGINRLVTTCSESLNEIVRVLSALSHGDLTQTIDHDYSGTFGQLKNDANATVEDLRAIVQQIKEATDCINTGSKEIAAGNNDLSNRTERQAASLEETAASMQQLTSTVRHNAENAKEANKLATEASDIAERGVEVVKQVVNTMADINDSSRKIGDIISVIDDIAFQTNILALNAAVEAARAGDQGKGFAVVAIEVRNLAQRAATAAGEIKNLISDSVSKVTGGTKLVTNAGETMGEIVTSIRGVSTMMSEITSASAEQSQGIEQVNQAVGEMDNVTQQNAALVEQSAAAAEALEEQAHKLAVSVSHFKVVENSRQGGAAVTAVNKAIKTSPTPAKKSFTKQPAATMQAGNDDWEEF